MKKLVYNTINAYTNKVSTKYSVMTGLPQVTHKIATSIIHSYQHKKSVFSCQYRSTGYWAGDTLGD